ncbi:hypothetical protein GW17_00043506, partial [Ensete ventricosum]
KLLCAGGVVLFTRALAPLKREGIRVNVLCPEFVQTEMGSKINPKIVDAVGGFLSMDTVVNGMSVNGLYAWYHTYTGHYRRLSVWIVHSLDHNFRSATKVVQTELKLPIKPHHALVKIIYAGVNASDVCFSGRYFKGKDNEIAARLPFDAGFEVPAKHLLPVPRPDAEVLAMLTSGLTASIALEKVGQMESGQVVLVTAAAGGTGQFAVQAATGASDPRARATTVRGRGQALGFLLFFFFLFLFFFFPFYPSIDPISPSINRRRLKSTANDRFLAVPLDNGRSAYQQPGGPVCTAHTRW